jgi:demethylmenaquinone methyltransferase/2-methoxy-6-polyprenyl-1,4-benzoquinol methylase
MKPDPVAVNSMFGRIAGRYDLANRILSGGMDIRWRARLVAAVRRVQPGDVLDLATGSGDVALALARGLPGETRIVGMDFCQPMLDQAEAKKDAAGPGSLGNLSFVAGDALAMAVPDSSFDAVTIAFGLRNMADRARCLSEIRRVLRPGGRLFVLEFSRPSPWFRPIYNLYLLRVSPLLAGALTGDRAAYRYLGESIGLFPSRGELSAEIERAGFDEVSASAMTLGIVALHQARRPVS